jgi:hypothetical protein
MSDKEERDFNDKKEKIEQLVCLTGCLPQIFVKLPVVTRHQESDKEIENPSS